MEDVVHGIKGDYSRDSLFDELGRIRLRESYMREDETSPQERFAYVSNSLVAILSMLNGCMTIPQNTGCRIAHLSSHLEEVNVVCLLVVF